LNNAIDAVSTCKEKWIRLEIILEGNILNISVVDSGDGVPVHLRELIKSPFFTTKPVGKGTGLGLSIVDGIIREMNGQFFLDEASPETRFVIKFPVQLV
jgi:C4-dicarboxylate-specific signal transduction histidine kinase